MKPILINILFISILLFTGCNIFSPLISASRTSDSPEGLVEEGKKEMRNGNNVQALKYFNDAIKKDSLYSDAWYFRSKMLLRIGDVIVPMLWNEIQPKDANGVLDKNKVPFFPKDTTWSKTVIYPNRVVVENGVTSTVNVTNADTLFNHYSRMYGPSMQAYLSLKRIWDGLTPRGTITSTIIRSDYLFLSSFFTSFITCDVNLDYRLDTSYIDNKERHAYITFAKSFSNINSIHLDADAVYGVYTVKDINKSIDSILGSSAITLQVLNSLDGEIQASKYSDSTDLNMLASPRKQLQDIIRQAGYYYYNDSSDNDNDWYDTQVNGRQDKMIWMDLDHDKLIDIGNGQHIKCDLESFKNDSATNGVTLRGDPLTGGATNLVCASIYGYRKIGTIRYFLYRGGYSDEFVAGDYGVDEEIIDDGNNDGDRNYAADTNGLKDEDSRIVPDTTDEDGDYVEYSTTHTIAGHKQYGLFIITWSGGYLNYHGSFANKVEGISIGGGENDTIIDDFGNTYRIEKKFDNTRVRAVMEIDNATFKDQLKCKLYEAMIVRAETPETPLPDAIIWDDHNNNGMIEDANGNRLTSPPAGYTGEFVGGDWGVDEEVYDGCDNDGDGRIDEDGDRKWFDPSLPAYQRPLNP